MIKIKYILKCVFLQQNDGIFLLSGQTADMRAYGNAIKRSELLRSDPIINKSACAADNLRFVVFFHALARYAHAFYVARARRVVHTA